MDAHVESQTLIKTVALVNILTIGSAYVISIWQSQTKGLTLTDLIQSNGSVATLLLVGMSVSCALAWFAVKRVSVPVLWCLILAVAMTTGWVHEIIAALAFATAAWISIDMRSLTGSLQFTILDGLIIIFTLVSAGALRARNGTASIALELGIVALTNLPLLG
jgi:hypothetical protein